MCCRLHCPEEQLGSGLCRYHWGLNECFYCYETVSANKLEWTACGTDGCTKNVRACRQCRNHFPQEPLLCDACWRSAGFLCIHCRATPARTERKYLHCCQTCFKSQAPEELYKLIRDESDHFIASKDRRQIVQGTEPALQLLLNMPTDPEPLMPYTDTPHYLNPKQCRSCLANVDDMFEHLHTCHPTISSIEHYRRTVLKKSLVEWPQKIAPQILRTRLAAFKSELCNANFAMAACASCARQKRRCKLILAVFVSPLCDACHAWLPWSAEQWLCHREAWYRQLDSLFDIDSYLKHFFHTCSANDAARHCLMFAVMLSKHRVCACRKRHVRMACGAGQTLQSCKH